MPARDANAAMDALRRIMRALRCAHTTALGERHVSAAQLFVLKVIAAAPGQSLADVSRHTLTSQSSASEVVARLVERGMVAREVAGNDHRRVQLSVTDFGAGIVHGAPETVQERLVRGFRSLSPTERVSLARGMQAWIVASGFEHVPATMFLEPG